MTGPEHHPSPLSSTPSDPRAAAPSPYGDPAAQNSAPRTTQDGSYITNPGEPGYADYQPYPGGHNAAAAGPARHPGYAPFPGGPGFGGYPQAPVRMPGSVRAAQVLAFIMGGLGIVLIVAGAVFVGAEAAGALTFGFGPFLVLAVLAFSFHGGGAPVRTLGITIGAFTALCGLGSTAAKQPPSVLGMVAGLTITILLLQRSARAWFTRVG